MIARIPLFFIACLSVVAHAQIKPDLTAYDPACEVKVQSGERGLGLSWLDEAGKPISIDLALDNTPLLSSIDVAGKPVARSLDLWYSLRTGTRTENPTGYVFFDNPQRRPMQIHAGALKIESAKVTSRGKRVTIALSKLTAGPFSGELHLHLYAGSPLIHVEAALTQTDKRIAYIYDAGLRGDFKRATWKNLSDHWESAEPKGDPKPIAVRNRTIFAEAEAGSIALFPPPHAFFFPRDYTNNLKFTQLADRTVGLRQDYSGGGAFVPWFDSHPGRIQRMGMFLLPSLQPGGEEALNRILRYTHNDSFKPMEGRKTFTSHYHSRLVVGKTPVPEFVHVMKRLGVNIVHLSEFHGDGNPNDPGPKRLPELQKYFEICRDFSDDTLALLPGEEGNKYLGKPSPGKHSGHWNYFFPKPVYFTFVRRTGEPFEETIRPYGAVYRVGSTADMVELIKRENGLVWTAHPRIKASHFTPDAFKDEPWYQDPMWLGAAWKAMPGDLSDDRLGVRCLDLLDDMNNWGQRKYLPGEVDVFELDRTHELYGHMNINYLRLDKVPSGAEWPEVLDVLRRGDFFVTTGEVLIHSCDITKSGVKVDLEWTFPLAFAEVIWGDGQKTHRKRLDLSDTREMGRQRYEWPVDLTDAKWVRFEAWDVATNGAFTQPTDPK